MERELKWVLPDRAVYERVAGRLGAQEFAKSQLNLYLDTPDGRIGAHRGAMLRIRQAGPNWTMTFKLGRSQQDGYFQSQEFEVELPVEVAEAIAAGTIPEVAWDWEPLQRFEAEFGVRELRVRGRLENLRRGYRLENGELAELDCSTFPDGSVDYELEVETEQPEVVRELVERLAGPLPAQSKTKYQRFLERSAR